MRLFYAGIYPIENFTGNAMKRIDTVITDYNELNIKHPGIDTGFQSLDNKGPFLRKGNLYLMGARPAMGKTTLSLQMAVNAATAGRSTVFFHLEASANVLAKRVVDWFSKCRPASIPLYIEDRIGNVNDFERCIRKNGITPELIVVDYLQLAYICGRNGTASYNGNKICHYLKSLAQTFHAAVLCTAMLNFTLELRDDHRPILTDIPSWSSITEHVDTIYLIYRDAYYNPKPKMECLETAEITCIRSTGHNSLVEIGWNPSNGTFYDLPKIEL